MKKILTFNTDAVYYFEKAMAKSDMGDYIGALELLSRAKARVEPLSNDDLAIRLEFADTLAYLELYRESLREYYKLLRFDYCGEDIYYGIIKNYLSLGMPEEGLYFYNIAVGKGYLSSDDGFEAVGFDDGADGLKPDAGKLRMVKSDDDRHTLAVAKQLLSASDSDFAKEMLETIGEDSTRYYEALGYLSLVELGEGNYKKCIELCDKVFIKLPESVSALATKIMALHSLDRLAEAAENFEVLDALDVKEWPDTARIATCACETGNDKFAYKYLSRCLTESPYDPDFCFLYALSAANLGHIKEAKETLVKMRLIYPKDYVITYYSRLLYDRSDKSERLKLRKELPQHEFKRIAALLGTCIEMPGGFTLDLMDEDPETDEAINYALYCDILPLQIKVIYALAECVYGEEYLLDILLDPDYPVIPKKEVLYSVLLSGRFKSVSMAVGYEVREYKLNKPSFIKNKSLFKAYCQVYSSVAFLTTDFEKRLHSVFKNTVDAFTAAGVKGKINVEAASAVIAYQSKLHDVFLQKSACCEMFGCSKADFDAYYEKIKGIKKTAVSKKIARG